MAPVGRRCGARVDRRTESKTKIDRTLVFNSYEIAHHIMGRHPHKDSNILKYYLLPLFTCIAILISSCSQKQESYIIEASERLVVVGNIIQSNKEISAEIYYYWPSYVIIDDKPVKSAKIINRYICSTLEVAPVSVTLNLTDGTSPTEKIDFRNFKKENSEIISILCNRAEYKHRSLNQSIDTIIEVYKKQSETTNLS